MTTKAERRADREAVGAYHETQLGALVDRVQRGLDRFRAGEIDAFQADEMIFQYSRAAKELWKFCSLGRVESAAWMIREEPPIDWWARGARRRR